ncbi:MAG TPA: hypothetical protein VKE96_15260 [Vicinamibacterales bacterium]|nr:hypothetical protein [Vicinamibacterales bacterium]
MVVSVTAVADVPPSLVSRVLDEAAAIWHPTGVAFVFRRVPWSIAARLDQNPFDAAGGLRIVIGNARGTSHDGLLPMGWIQFEHESPAQEIYLSYRNAIDFMTDSSAVAGAITHMPPVEKEIKLARAMGRALAHELGHYLLASKAHTQRGLMRASHTASEFFDFSRRGFEIDLAQRQLIAALWRDGVIASR